jgi:hypothetical protein
MILHTSRGFLFYQDLFDYHCIGEVQVNFDKINYLFLQLNQNLASRQLFIHKV